MEGSISQQLTEAINLLSGHSSIDNPRLDSELLLAHCLQKDRSWLKVWPERELSQQQISAFHELLARRKQGEPIAYILGYKDFWTLTLKVTADTLVPRPETETLVEQALLKISTQSEAKTHVVDLGTGSGSIALAIASERPYAKVFAVEFSLPALRIAQENAQQNQIDNVEMIHGSWLENWSYGELDVIVSNPPYVEEGDPHLHHLTYEPYQALVAGEQGLADIKTITQQAVSCLKSGGWLMFEHGYDQALKVQAILTENGFCRVQSVNDLAGQNRVTFGQYLP
ncbi:MAG: peptide chain release factor N(5)-glutamine methyltransferase [Kangiellaceae bacterium]|nr:peptide chain release factor N(5)-glutamine methyltransferase [Kangiellaceae bacterium]